MKQKSGCLKIGLIVFLILAVFGIGVIGCLALAGNEVAKEIDKAVGVADPDDYEITEVQCTEDEFLGLQATGKIKNTSDEPQAFQVSVRWVNEDGDLITDDSTFTNRMDVGQSQQWKVTSLTDRPEGSTPECSVSEVSYTIFD